MIDRVRRNVLSRRWVVAGVASAVALLGVPGHRVIALLAGPAQAQGNPRVEEAARLVGAIIADPTKREALCAYQAALSKMGAAQTGVSSSVTVGKREAQKQQSQIEAMRKLGAAQGEARMAANRISPEFHAAVETLRIGDPLRYLNLVAVRLRQLCPGS